VNGSTLPIKKKKKKKTNSSALQGAGKVQGPALEVQEFSCTELQAQNRATKKSLTELEDAEL
jgi:hypothetical protein